MSYGGESNSKKRARAMFWMHAFNQLNGSVRKPENARFMVLSGPIAADARVLIGLGVRPGNIVAVDSDEDALRSSMDVCPGVDYQLGDVRDVARRKEYRRKIDALFLDLCSPVSRRTMGLVAHVAANAVRPMGVVGAGFMYGREGPEARETVGAWRGEIEREHAALVDGRFDELSPLTRARAEKLTDDEIEELRSAPASGVRHALALQAREGYIGIRLTQAAIKVGVGVVGVGTIAYRSGRRVNGKSIGTPMLYYMGRLYRPHRPCKNRDELWRRIQGFMGFIDRTVKPFHHDCGDDPDGEKLKRTAAGWAELHDSAWASDVLCVPKQSIAAWKAWDTRRSRKEDAVRATTNELGCQSGKEAIVD